MNKEMAETLVRTGPGDVDADDRATVELGPTGVDPLPVTLHRRFDPGERDGATHHFLLCMTGQKVGGGH